MKYLTHSELSLILGNPSPLNEASLFFQTNADFPAFLSLAPSQVEEFSSVTNLALLDGSIKKAMRLILPGIAIPANMEFIPINAPLSPFVISRYLLDFNVETSTVSMMGGVDYKLFDDKSSDLFVIARSNLAPSELNTIYTGDYRVTPKNVIKTLKQVAILLKNITLSNTQEITPLGENTTPIDPPPPPPVTVEKLIDGSDQWIISRGGPFGGTNISQIRLENPWSTDVADFTVNQYAQLLTNLLANQFPGKNFTLSNCAYITIPGISSYIKWDVYQF
jgi:hypothetical protein